jgi:RNA polymerase sigma-70 factor, ECF subfamily
MERIDLSDNDNQEPEALRMFAAARSYPAALEQTLAEHRVRLRRMVALRMDRRLQGRVDPSDVIQEAYLEATRRLPEYLREPDPIPMFLWLRLLAVQALHVLHRHYLGAIARDAGREISIQGGRMPLATSGALAAQLLGRDTRARDAAIRAERMLRLEQALNQMDPLDREVLALRHFEQLSNFECSTVLDMKETTAMKRYLRALEKLREILAALPGGCSEAWL